VPITDAVIPVAGLGTRLLPATRSSARVEAALAALGCETLSVRA
jgi:hypothetical protein